MWSKACITTCSRRLMYQAGASGLFNAVGATTWGHFLDAAASRAYEQVGDDHAPGEDRGKPTAAQLKDIQGGQDRILVFEDTNGDGKFDRKTIFADKMMFPAGTMWKAGSLYVAAPPSIWKLTSAPICTSNSRSASPA